jgi:hypothetical protein
MMQFSYNSKAQKMVAPSGIFGSIETATLLFNHFWSKTSSVPYPLPSTNYTTSPSDMAMQYVKDQPKGFTNRIERVAVVGVCRSYSESAKAHCAGK